MHFKNRFKVYLKYALLQNCWWTQSILETYKFKLFFSYFTKFTNFGNQNIFKIILKVYFIWVQYIWSIPQFKQKKVTNKSLYNLWRNGLMDRVQVNQTKDPRFKTIRWLKKCLSLSTCKDQSNENLGCLGNWWLKVSPPTDNWTLSIKWSTETNEPKKGPLFFCKVYLKYTSEVQLKYA